MTAVAIGIGVSGEASHLTPTAAVAQAGFALLAVGGVLVLARQVPDPHPEPAPAPLPTKLERVSLGV